MSPQFSIKAGWPDGTVGEESVLAPDSKAARVEVERRGGHVFEVRRHGLVLSGGRSGRKRRVKMADFLVFNQEMIALLKAGLPVVRSFEILLERQESVALREVLADVKDRVNSGASISDAFAEQGDLFPRLYWTSLKAGEKSGEIEAVLRRYLKYQKTVMAISRKVVSTLVYPAILMLLSAVLITILMTVVIPKFQDFFADFQADLPLLTVIVVGIAGISARQRPVALPGDPLRRMAPVALGAHAGRTQLGRRRPPEAPVSGQAIPPLRDHAVHAQPRDSPRGRNPARPLARELGRRHRQPARFAPRPRGRFRKSGRGASCGRPSTPPGSSPT